MTPPSAMIEQVRRALSQRPDVRLAVLFGSRARGTERGDSDLDLAVWAPGVDTLRLAADLALATGVEVDVIALDDPGVPLLEAIVRDGVPVHERAHGAFATWRAHAIASLETDRPWFARMRDAWLREVATNGVARGRP